MNAATSLAFSLCGSGVTKKVITFLMLFKWDMQDGSSRDQSTRERLSCCHIVGMTRRLIKKARELCE